MHSIGITTGVLDMSGHESNLETRLLDDRVSIEVLHSRLGFRCLLGRCLHWNHGDY